jgi:hypothetical protein
MAAFAQRDLGKEDQTAEAIARMFRIRSRNADCYTAMFDEAL